MQFNLVVFLVTLEPKGDYCGSRFCMVQLAASLPVLKVAVRHLCGTSDLTFRVSCIPSVGLFMIGCQAPKLCNSSLCLPVSKAVLSRQALHAEIVVTFEGVTEAGALFSAKRSYLPGEIHWGYVFAPIVRPAGPGCTQHAVDLSRCAARSSRAPAAEPFPARMVVGNAVACLR